MCEVIRKSGKRETYGSKGEGGGARNTKDHNHKMGGGKRAGRGYGGKDSVGFLENFVNSDNLKHIKTKFSLINILFFTHKMK